MAGKISMTVLEVSKFVLNSFEAHITPLHNVLSENGCEPIGGVEMWEGMKDYMKVRETFNKAMAPSLEGYYRKVLQGRRSTGILPRPGQIYRALKYAKPMVDEVNEAVGRELKVLKVIQSQGGTKLVDRYFENPHEVLEELAKQEVDLH